MAQFGSPAGMPPGSGVRHVSEASSKDRVKGALFKGLLLFSLAIGFVTLTALLVDVARDGLGHLNWDFITSFPSSLPSRAGIQSPIVGTIYLMILVALITIPDRRRRRDLPGGVRRQGPLVQPRDRDQHPEPRRGAVDRLRNPRPGLPGSGPRPRARAAGGSADAQPARPADRDHRLARGDPGGARRDPGRGACARRDPLADDPPPGAARPPSPASPPARSWPSRGRSARRRP